jgi:hypothetical protein
LSFAEMAELARCDCPAGRRMAELLASVIRPEEAQGKSSRAVRKSGEGRRAPKKSPPDKPNP